MSMCVQISRKRGYAREIVYRPQTPSYTHASETAGAMSATDTTFVRSPKRTKPVADPRPDEKRFRQQLDPKTLRSCSNCGTSATSIWRMLGRQVVCNACKCFYRKHGHSRPQQLRRDIVLPRQRRRTGGMVSYETVFKLDDGTHEASDTWHLANNSEQPFV